MTVYHKLVRDFVPDIIEKSGRACIMHVLEDDSYLTALNAKLAEELAEYQTADPSDALEELADLLEVLYAVVRARGYSLEKLEEARAEKARLRGGFDKQIMLDEVIEPFK